MNLTAHGSATFTVPFDPATLSPAIYLAMFGEPKPSTLAVAIATALNPKA